MELKELLEWIIQNKDWLFSGVALVIIGGIFKLFRKRQGSPSNIFKQTNKGRGNTNIQANTININKGKEEKDV
jgi:hypothetical protein